MIKNEILHGYRLYGGASLQVYEVRRETYEITFGFRLAIKNKRKTKKRTRKGRGGERETEKKEDRKRIKGRKDRERECSMKI